MSLPPIISPPPSSDNIPNTRRNHQLGFTNSMRNPTTNFNSSYNPYQNSLHIHPDPPQTPHHETAPSLYRSLHSCFDPQSHSAPPYTVPAHNPAPYYHYYNTIPSGQYYPPASGIVPSYPLHPPSAYFPSHCFPSHYPQAPFTPCSVPNSTAQSYNQSSIIFGDHQQNLEPPIPVPQNSDNLFLPSHDDTTPGVTPPSRNFKRLSFDFPRFSWLSNIAPLEGWPKFETWDNKFWAYPDDVEFIYDPASSYDLPNPAVVPPQPDPHLTNEELAATREWRSNDAFVKHVLLNSLSPQVRDTVASIKNSTAHDIYAALRKMYGPGD